MVKEILAEIVEVRPGRRLFCRHLILGADAVLGQEDEPAIAPPSPNAVLTQHVVCIHGTAASQEPYLPLLAALDGKLDQHHDEDPPQRRVVHCWLYDAVGCGRSPKGASPGDYGDDAQVEDLHAFVTNLVLPEMKSGLSTSSSTPPELFMMGHSYGPTWIFKWMSFMEEEQPQERGTGSMEMSDSSLIIPTGVILLCTGVESTDLVRRGPFLFRYDYVPPIWFLKWVQPSLTKMFLKVGFSEETRRDQPELVAQSQQANNQNDMQVVRFYYRSHDWLSDLSGFASKGCRFLVVHGSQDGIIPIHNGQVVANQLGTDLVAIDDASHMVFQEQPETTAGHVFRSMLSAEGWPE